MDKKMILAIDDISESLTVIKTILEDRYDLRLSKSPQAALELLSNSPVDLILLDIEMPRMSGFNFLKHLHRTFPEYFKNIPVIVVTAHASYHFIKQALALGVKGYMVKPINDMLLLEKIEAIIGSPDTDQSLDVELPVSVDTEKKDSKDSAMKVMDDLFLDDIDDLFLDDMELNHQVTLSLKQIFTNMRHACFIHSIQAEALAKELQEQYSNISKRIDFLLIRICELISNYEYEKALAKLIKLEKELGIIQICELISNYEYEKALIKLIKLEKELGIM